MAGDAKNNEGLERCISQKRKVTESASPLISKTGKLETV